MAGLGEQAYFPQPFLEAKTGVVVAPFQFGLAGDDSLRVLSVNSYEQARLTIKGRRLTAEGEIVPFAFSHTPYTDRTVKTEVFNLGRGALLNVAVFGDQSPYNYGVTFVCLQIVRGFQGPIEVVGILVQGYVTVAQGLGWPGSPILQSFDGPGLWRSVFGTTPALGAEIVETVPVNARWHLQSFRATLTTGPIVANRQVDFLFDDGTPAGWRVPLVTNLIASTAWRFYLSVGIADQFGGANNVVYGTLPDHLIMPPAWFIRSSTSNMQVGDVWSAIRYTLREWLMVP